MPISNYDNLCGSKGCAQEIYDAMIKEYGAKKGRQIFYAKIAMLKKSKGNNGGN